MREERDKRRTEAREIRGKDDGEGERPHLRTQREENTIDAKGIRKSQRQSVCRLCRKRGRKRKREEMIAIGVLVVFSLPLFPSGLAGPTVPVFVPLPLK